MHVREPLAHAVATTNQMEDNMNAFSRAKAAIFVGLYAFLAAGDVLAAEQDVRAIDSGLFKSTDINGDGKV